MVEFYIVRHGKTEFNEQGIMQGQLDSALLKNSLVEAKKLCEKLKEIDFDIIISSDLGRALVTAEIIKNELDNNISFETSNEIREINFGDFGGKKIEEIRKQYPQFKKDIKFTPPNGENYQQLYDRVIKFIKNLDNKYDKVLLVTHAGCIRAIYSFFNDEDFEKNLLKEFSNNVIVNAILKDKKPDKFEIIQN